MKSQERFLALYKEYELLLRDDDLEVRDVEDSLDGVNKGRLWLCRHVRNYLSHNNDLSFFEPSQQMLAFLEDKIKTHKLQKDVAKAHLKSLATAACTDKDKCGEVLAKMIKLKHEKMPMSCGSGWCVVSIFDVATSAIKNKATKMGAVKHLREKVRFCSPLDPADSIDREAVILCTDTGDASGKVLGVVHL